MTDANDWASAPAGDNEWLQASGLDRAYHQLVFDGFCCGADDAPQDMNDQWVEGLRERIEADGLLADFKHVRDNHSISWEYGADICLCRLKLPDGTLPPDPAAHLGQRAEIVRALYQAWGERLVSARRHAEQRTRLTAPH